MKRERRTKSLSRRNSDISPKAVLIVCEGEKTEPQYFERLKTLLRLTAATVEVVHENNAPTSVVETAVKRMRAAKRAGLPYDRVFCVIDRDGHADFDTALDRANQNGIDVAHSVPCFEYWLVLHYEFSTAPADRCQGMISRLLQLNGNYRKGILPQGLVERHPTACGHAERARRSVMADDNRFHNPVTYVDGVVRHLRNISNETK